MRNKVLLLNSDSKPLATISAKKAFLLVHLDKVKVLHNYSNLSIKSVNSIFDYPSVIQLNTYVSGIYDTIVLTRNNIYRRDYYRCVYCDSKVNLTLDHLIPVSKGGKSTWNNLVTCCKKCNTMKGDKLLKDTNMKVKRLPYKPSFIDFILYNNENKSDVSWGYYLT